MPTTQNIINHLDQELNCKTLSDEHRAAASNLRDLVMLKQEFDANSAFRSALCDRVFNILQTGEAA